MGRYCLAILSEREDRVKKAIADGTVDWRMLCELSESKDQGSTEDRTIGEKLYLDAIDAFKKKHGDAQVAFFQPVGGVYLLRDGSLHYSFYGGAINFDWTEARRLLFKADALAEEAKEWWREPASEARNRRERWVGRLFDGLSRRRGAAEERRPHSMRAYGIVTMLLGAVHRENSRKHEPDEEGLAPPLAPFQKDMLDFQTEVRDAQDQFRRAAQRTAQSRYWQGTMIGALLLGGVTAVGGIVFAFTGTKAAYGIALPAGALGAMVSVLQRMSSGKLKLEYEAGRDLLEVFGAVRPFIGAIFGLAVMALLLGGFVPAVVVPSDEKLAFFAALGFLAGFNERWAQDMLNTAAHGVGRSGGGEAVGRRSG
jgi:hypothetical protein